MQFDRFIERENSSHWKENESTPQPCNLMGFWWENTPAIENNRDLKREHYSLSKTTENMSKCSIEDTEDWWARQHAPIQGLNLKSWNNSKKQQESWPFGLDPWPYKWKFQTAINCAVLNHQDWPIYTLFIMKTICIEKKNYSGKDYIFEQVKTKVSATKAILLSSFDFRNRWRQKFTILKLKIAEGAAKKGAGFDAALHISVKKFLQFGCSRQSVKSHWSLHMCIRSYIPRGWALFYLEFYKLPLAARGNDPWFCITFQALNIHLEIRSDPWKVLEILFIHFLHYF